MRPDLAWPLSEGAGVVVAVIDSGVSTTHPALENKVLAGRDFLASGTAGQCDEAAHGTLVAGVIAGRQSAGSAFHGVAPKASILPIRVLRDLKRNLDKNTPNVIAEAIIWAADQNVHVINLSLTTDPTPAVAAAVRYALSKRVVIVAAAGNEGGSQDREKPTYPAAFDGVIAVAGINEQDQHVDTSTSGDYVDVAAPGANVEGPVPQGGGYAQFEAGGTSFAAAYVSGLAALVRAKYPNLDPGQVADRIYATADHPPEGRNPQVGHGVINPYRALASIGGGVAAAVPPAALAPPQPEVDPMARTRVIAAWTASVAVLIALLVLLAAFVARQSRLRRPPKQEKIGTSAGQPSAVGRASPGNGALPVRAGGPVAPPRPPRQLRPPAASAATARVPTANVGRPPQP